MKKFMLQKKKQQQQKKHNQEGKIPGRKGEEPKKGMSYGMVLGAATAASVMASGTVWH